MSPSLEHDDHYVRPTKFKPIDVELSFGDDQVYKSAQPGEKTYPKNSTTKDETMPQKPNFLLGYSFPAVVFDRVCFSVDKSQQQSRFILNDCINYLKSFARSEEQILDQKVAILKSVCLNVPHGSIFGLLGPSSCGKTTLLRCLVGLLKPSSGSISLFGSNLWNDERETSCSDALCNLDDLRGRVRQSGECQVPGQSVGYMPQDLGLYEDFTIEQLLTMFGRYMRMERELIRERISFMTKFLDLPEKDRQISTLSGGQKRRVSFAIACLHMPPLIILDEPTVGVDPLLRKSIWRYLRKLASDENKTIIITTHYIEEAAQADQVALMRAGEILVQDRPAKIMKDNNCKTLEEAFLRICNKVQPDPQPEGNNEDARRRAKSSSRIYPQPRFVWPSEPNVKPNVTSTKTVARSLRSRRGNEESLAQFDELTVGKRDIKSFDDQAITSIPIAGSNTMHNSLSHRVSMTPDRDNVRGSNFKDFKCDKLDLHAGRTRARSSQVDDHLVGPDRACVRSLKHRKKRALRILKRDQFNIDSSLCDDVGDVGTKSTNYSRDDLLVRNKLNISPNADHMINELKGSMLVLWALLYKNYRRNVNSIPLIAFQFLLPLIQMISFSLCVGGRPSNIGLGVVNFDHLPPASTVLIDAVPAALLSNISAGNRLERMTPVSSESTRSVPYIGSNLTSDDLIEDYNEDETQLLSLKYLGFIDTSMISIYEYDSLDEALEDVRRVKLWAAMEIGENFTSTIAQRFDLENFYQLDRETTRQSIIRLYPDSSNKVLDMVCQRSLANSYRKFLMSHFDHFKRLPVEVKSPIFDIKPNIISDSIDGYTESIAPGLLASLTYIMAAGLTTFIMVVERSDGILERTYTSGINPVLYLLAHAIFRSVMMMLQIAAVLFLTFYILRQPIVGSIWLAYSMLMTLNMTGISYGLLISSLVVDQNGAALTIVGSLVVKITLSGILWPFEAIPRWLRMICYVQPLTMPVQALKSITLKGATITDRSVFLGFFVAISWLLVFLYIAARRFKFYQH